VVFKKAREEDILGQGYSNAVRKWTVENRLKKKKILGGGGGGGVGLKELVGIGSRNRGKKEERSKGKTKGKMEIIKR